MRHLILTTLVCLAAATAIAQPCEDWSDVMARPEVRLPFAGSPLPWGDHLLAAGQFLQVCSPATPLFEVVGQCDLPAGGPRRLVAAHGQPYAVCGTAGVLRIDASDPTDPGTTTVFDPDLPLEDLAAFAGGFVVVDADGGLMVLDLEFAPISQVSLGRPVSRVVASGGWAVAAGQGDLFLVDLAAPDSPVVSDLRPCFPEGELAGALVHRDLFRHGDVVYATSRYSGDPLVPDSFLLAAFDLGDPSDPTVIGCRYLSETAWLGWADERLVTFSAQGLSFRDPLTLEAVGSLGHEPALAPMSGPVAWGGSLLLSDFAGISELDLTAPFPIAPVATIADGLDPAGCGPFGLATYDERVAFDEVVRHWVVLDQSDPLAPLELAHHQQPLADVSPHDTRAIRAQDDRWALIVEQTSTVDGLALTLQLMDRQGGVVVLDDGLRWVNAALDADRLWVAQRDGTDAASLRLWDVGGDPVELASLPVDVPGKIVVLDDHLALVGGDAIDLYDVTDPLDPTLTGSLASTSIFDGPVIPIPGHLVVGESGSVIVVGVDPGADTPLLRRGHVSLGALWLSAMAHDDVTGSLAVATSEPTGWTIVSLADLDAPAVISPTVADRVSGFAWVTPHLYVRTASMVEQYDVSDPAQPLLRGYAGLHPADQSLCILGGLLMDAGWVLPLDCQDNVSVEDPHEPEVPSAAPMQVTLYPASPNPFNPRTRVSFDLASRERVEVGVYDLRGRCVATLADHPFDAGRHTLLWMGQDHRGRALPSATYLIRLRTDTAVRTTKAVLVR